MASLLSLLRPRLLRQLASSSGAVHRRRVPSYPTISSAVDRQVPSLHPSPLHFFSSPPPRFFSSSPGSSNIVLIGSADQFNTTLNKVEDEGGSAIFYFTATWCGPCRFISPIIEDMSKKFPHVTTYKIDIDQEGLGAILNKLKIYSVPTLHFFQSGKRAAEIVGADAAQLKNTMENLYKQD